MTGSLDTIEETLRQLRLAMESHRRSLAMDGTVDPPPSSGDPRDVAPRSPGRLAPVCAEIERVAGVNVSGAVAAKLDRLFAATDDAALAAWIDRVRRPGLLHPDLQLLIESLTTHETYFFRDPAQLDLLRTDMLPRLIAASLADGRRHLRLWSAGCSTGEEAYSLAVIALAALSDAGEATVANGRATPLPGWRVEVVGTDISGRALDTAAAGIYRTGRLASFREAPPASLAYFPEVPRSGTRRVCDELRAIVRFSRFNLMDPTPPVADCDVVVCRNVLIYLTADAGRRVQDLLYRALRIGGCLLLGPTDQLVEAERYEARWSGTRIVHSRLAS